MARISLSYPDSGLTISIVVKNRATGVTAFTGSMSEVSTTGAYIYDFTEVVDTDYVYTATVTGYDAMKGTIYRDGGGLTTNQANLIETNLDKKVSNVVTGFFGKMGSEGDYGISDREEIKEINKGLKKIEKKIEEMPKISLDKIENTLDETREDISLAKGEIITRIKEVETEVCSDIVRKTKELKEDNVSTRNLVRQKSDKVVKFATKQLDTMERIEKEIEDTENEIKEEFERVEQEEKEIADMFDEYELEEEEIKKEFDKLDSNT